MKIFRGKRKDWENSVGICEILTEENQAAVSSCLCVWPYLGGGEVTLQPQDGEKMLPSAGSILGRSLIPGFFPTMADQPPSFPHHCVPLMAASGGWLSERSKQAVLGAKGVYLALKIHASPDEASTTVPTERILPCNYFTHQKSKDPSAFPFCLICIGKSFGNCFFS